MTYDRHPNRAYLPIPTVINPATTRLFCFEIPEHPEHYAAFWGAMESLAQAYTWGTPRTADSDGVAAVWRNITDLNRTRFLEQLGCGAPETCEDGDCIEGGCAY